MNDQWTNRLSEYIDGELDSTERAGLEAHLATCGHCYATLGELQQVVARAKALTNAEPETDLWPDIKARLNPSRRPGVAPRRLASPSRSSLRRALPWSSYRGAVHGSPCGRERRTRPSPLP